MANPALRDIITGMGCSPDGKWLAYLLRGEQIVVRDLVSGREIELGNVIQGGNWRTSLAWTEDSGAVLIGMVGRVGGSEIVAHPLNGDSPYSVYSTASKIGNFATGAGLLALVTDTSRSNLARASASPAPQPDIIDPANGLTWSPSFAPDGTLAFASNRSGTNAIWLMKPESAPVMLFDAALSPIHSVRFSPTGTRLAVASETTQRVTVKIMAQGQGPAFPRSRCPHWVLGCPLGRRTARQCWYSTGTSCAPCLSLSTMSHRHNPFAPPHWVGIAVRKDGTFATRADRPDLADRRGNKADQ